MPETRNCVICGGAFQPYRTKGRSQSHVCDRPECRYKWKRMWQQAYDKARAKDPERNLRRRESNQTTERQAYERARAQDPERRQRQREAFYKPERQAYERARAQDPEEKKRRAERNRRYEKLPHVKARRRELDAMERKRNHIKAIQTILTQNPGEAKQP